MMSRMGTRGRILAVAAALVVAGTGLAFADGAASADHRQAEMKKMGGAMKRLSQSAKGEQPFGPETVAAAEAIQAVGHEIPALFKDNEPAPKSRAKPEVWSDAGKFAAAAKAFSDTTPALVAAAGGTDMVETSSEGAKVSCMHVYICVSMSMCTGMCWMGREEG